MTITFKKKDPTEIYKNTLSISVIDTEDFMKHIIRKKLAAIIKEKDTFTISISGTDENGSNILSKQFSFHEISKLIEEGNFDSILSKEYNSEHKDLLNMYIDVLKLICCDEVTAEEQIEDKLLSFPNDDDVNIMIYKNSPLK